jgi:cell division protein FtsW
MDRTLLFVQLALGALGVVGVAAGRPELAFEQATRVGMALVLTVIVARLRPKAITKLSPYLFVVTFVLLVVTLFRGVSPEGSESRRWLDLGGFTLQPSEFMKIAVIAYLTAFFHNHLGDWHIWRPMLVIGLAVAAIVAQPNLSTGLFVFLLAFALMVMAGISATRLASITLAAGLIGALLGGSYLSQFSYMKDRLIGYADLWGNQELVQGEAYQAAQARAAIARGGLTGIGAGRGVAVPEVWTDFVSVAIAQAMGLFGVAALIVLYLVLASRGIAIARAVTGPPALLAGGAVAYVCGQAAVNLLVASGLFPVTGLPLPGVSYGFNSLLSVGIAFGFLHVAYRQAVKGPVEAREPALAGAVR